MTVTFHFVEAASTKKRDPQKYKWYQLAKGKAKFDSAHKDFELELRRGEKFGLKFYRGSYFLVDEDDLSVQFKLSAEEGKKLIASSEPFSGKIAGKQVEGGEANSTRKAKPKPSINPKQHAHKLAKSILGSGKSVTLQHDGLARWHKKGGHAGSNQLDKIVERAKALGFKKSEPSTQRDTPDGSNTSRIRVYEDSEGNILRVSVVYGPWAPSNSFTAEFQPSPSTSDAIADQNASKQKAREADPKVKAIREVEAEMFRKVSELESLRDQLGQMLAEGATSKNFEVKKVKQKIGRLQREVNALDRKSTKMRK